MNKEIIDRESLLDGYVLEDMSSAERQEFEAMLEEDDELRGDLEFLEDVTEALSRRDQNIQKMKQWQAQSVSKTEIRVVNWRRISLAVAACAALFISISYPYSYYGLQDRGFLDSQVRGGYVELAEYVENDQYELVLKLVDDSVKELEASLPSSAHPDYVVSEINYLVWTKIQTLLKMREYELAYREVSAFRSDAGNYQAKADKLYKRLKLRLRK